MVDFKLRRITKNDDNSRTVVVAFYEGEYQDVEVTDITTGNKSVVSQYVRTKKIGEEERIFTPLKFLTFLASLKTRLQELGEPITEQK